MGLPGRVQNPHSDEAARFPYGPAPDQHDVPRIAPSLLPRKAPGNEIPGTGIEKRFDAQPRRLSPAGIRRRRRGGREGLFELAGSRPRFSRGARDGAKTGRGRAAEQQDRQAGAVQFVFSVRFVDARPVGIGGVFQGFQNAGRAPRHPGGGGGGRGGGRNSIPGFSRKARAGTAESKHGEGRHGASAGFGKARAGTAVCSGNNHRRFKACNSDSAPESWHELVPANPPVGSAFSGRGRVPPGPGPGFRRGPRGGCTIRRGRPRKTR